MSTRHTFAAALVVLAIVATLWPVAIAQDKKPEASEADASCNRMPADADERERKIYDALAKPVEVDFEEKPLKDVVVKLAQTSGIQIQFDEKALSEAAVATDTPITKRLHGISLRSTLRLLLRPLQLTYVIRNGVLLITSQTEAENQLVLRVYPIRDIVLDENEVPDFEALLELITTIVDPPSWDIVGGVGSVQLLEPGVLVISQTNENHESIAPLLAALRKDRANQIKSHSERFLELCHDKPSQAILETLKKPFSIEILEEPLIQAAQAIGQKSKLQVVLDEKALTEAGIATDIPITKTIHDLPLRDGLQLLLRPLQLTFVLTDEVLMITSQTEAENRLSTRLYPVEDLIRHVPAYASNVGIARYDFDPLIDTISAAIAPQTWDTVGGPGSVQGFEPSKVLVVRQTDEVHQLLADLLAQVRRVTQQAASESTTSAENNEPVLRIYTLNERVIVPKTEKPAQPGPSKESDKQSTNTQRGEQLKQTTLAGFGRWVPNVSHQLAGDHWVIVPPQGVPAEEAATLVRNLVQPESWNESGVLIQPATNRLLVKHKLSAHLEIAKLLQRLGPWQEEDDGHMFMRPKVGGFLGGGLGGGQNMTGMGF